MWFSWLCRHPRAGLGAGAGLSQGGVSSSSEWRCPVLSPITGSCSLKGPHMQHPLLGLSTGWARLPRGLHSSLWWARGDRSHGNLLWAVWWVEGPCWDGGRLLPHLHRARAQHHRPSCSWPLLPCHSQAWRVQGLQALGPGSRMEVKCPSGALAPCAASL